MPRATTRLSVKRLADPSLRVPSPILLLCLVFLIQSLSASFSTQHGAFLVRGYDADYDLVNPVTDTWDYENPDQDPVIPDKDLDKLRPDESGKPNATGGGNNDGKGDDKKGDDKKGDDKKGDDKKDNGKPSKRPNKDADRNDEKKPKARDDTDSDLEVTTAGGTDVAPEQQGVTIVDGVVTVPAAVNGTIVANVPEILPPVPVAQETSSSGVPPMESPPEMMEVVVDQVPGETTGGVASRVVGLVVAAVVGILF